MSPSRLVLFVHAIDMCAFPWFGICAEHEKVISHGPALSGVRQRDDQARQERVTSQ